MRVAERDDCAAARVPGQRRRAAPASSPPISPASPIAAAVIDDVVLVATELVSNAIRHAEPLAGGASHRRLAGRCRREVTVRVTDGGAPQPARGAAPVRRATPPDAGWPSSKRSPPAGASRTPPTRTTVWAAARRLDADAGSAGAARRAVSRQAAHHPQRHRQGRQVDLLAAQRIGERGRGALDPGGVAVLPLRDPLWRRRRPASVSAAPPR